MDTLQQQMQTVFNNVIDALKTTVEKQLNEIPFEGSWTIGQTADHIVLCSRGVQDGKTKTADRTFDEHVAALREMFADMEQKSEAASVVYPAPPPHNKQKLIEQLEANKANLIKIAEEKDLAQLSMDIEFPGMGYLTRFEWLSFICVHTQRHLNQIENVKKILAAKQVVL